MRGEGKQALACFPNLVLDYFYLNELDDEKLETILNLEDDDFIEYACYLIENFYPSIESGSEQHLQLVTAYRASFILEQLYRQLEILHVGFTAIYTKTGLLREVVNDVYEIGPNKTAVN